MATIDTLGDLIDHGFRLSIHCENQFCRHYTSLDLHALAERFGRDFVTIGKPNPLTARMRCSKCGGKDLGLILQPVTGNELGPFSSGPDYGVERSVDRPHVKGRRARRRVRI
jgi:hypothetical protein